LELQVPEGQPVAFQGADETAPQHRPAAVAAEYPGAALSEAKACVGADHAVLGGGADVQLEAIEVHLALPSSFAHQLSATTPTSRFVLLASLTRKGSGPEHARLRVSLEGRAGRRIEQRDDVWIVVCDRVDVVHRHVVSVLDILLRFASSEEAPA